MCCPAGFMWVASPAFLPPKVGFRLRSSELHTAGVALPRGKTRLPHVQHLLSPGGRTPGTAVSPWWAEPESGVERQPLEEKQSEVSSPSELSP